MATVEKLKEEIEALDGVRGAETYLEGMYNDQTGIGITFEDPSVIQEVKDIIRGSTISFHTREMTASFTITEMEKE